MGGGIEGVPKSGIEVGYPCLFVGLRVVGPCFVALLGFVGVHLRDHADEGLEIRRLVL